MNEIIQGIKDYILDEGVTISRSIVFILLGYIFFQSIIRILKRTVNKTKIDKTLPNFLISILNIIFIGILLIYVLHSLNVSTDSIFTIASVLTLALSLALQDILKSFANGIIIVTTKPFKEGDFIQIGNVEGTVYSITMFHTILNTFDGVLITIPNLEVTTNSVKNFSNLRVRRIDIIMPVSYKSDINTIKEIFMDVTKNTINVLNDPFPIVRIDNLDNSNINILVRCWCLNEFYWGCKAQLLERLYESVTSNNIRIDYQQVDVLLKGFNNYE